MAIEEKAINTTVANLLTKDHGLDSTPEERGRHGQPDIKTKVRADSEMVVVTEAKVGTDKKKKEQATKDAVRRLKTMPKCQSAIALCYPPEIVKVGSEMNRMVEETADLEFVRVNEKGPADEWRKGSVAELALTIKTAQEDHGATVSKWLKTAIEAATTITSDADAKRLAAELNLTDPKASAKDRRGAKIAFLILVNTMLIQSRLHQVNAVDNLASLGEIRKDHNIAKDLRQAWELIKAVDYVPVVNPALAVLNRLGNAKANIRQLRILLEAAQECESLVGDLRLDHAGPLYHSLLASAPFDGSFYTSTVAATILAHLVMPNDWTEEDWKNENKITGLKICDPACGTGTLLMATASTLLERHRKAKGEKNTHTDRIFGKIVENVLYGIDINQHAIHLAAAMLTVSAPRVNYNRLNIFRAWHGVAGERTFTGSLELLSDKRDWLVPEVAPQTQAEQVKAKSMTAKIPDIQGVVDIVIMNPPFTRNDIRSRQYPKNVRKAVQNREVEIAKSTLDALRQRAIHQTTIGTFFSPIADVLIKPETGTVGIVKPLTICTNPAGREERKLLATKFHIEAIVTTHDNRRIYFSENTNIHECLIVARRREQKKNPPPRSSSTSRTTPPPLTMPPPRPRQSGRRSTDRRRL